MTATYYLKENELDEGFLQKLKTQFTNRKLTITVVEEMDETDYLLSSSANADRLLKAIANVKEKKELIDVDMNKLKQLIAK